MQCCPICGKEQIQGPVCDDCGFDFSCDYEGRRTLGAVLPEGAEPVSVRAAKRKQRQQQVIAVSPADLVCPKCGGKHFWFQIDELQFLCTDCKTEIPIAIQRDRSADAAPSVLVLLVDGIGSRTQRSTAAAMSPGAAVDNRKRQTLPLKRAVGPTIAAGAFHTVGLKADGTMAAVGPASGDKLDAGQCGVGGWTEIVAVDALADHTVGLKADGTVVACGDNTYGQCGVNGWRSIATVAAGDFHTVGLKADGTVVAVGYNESSSCNVAGWKDIVAVTAGGFHTVGVKTDGTVVAVGWTRHGQCKVGSWTDIVAVAAGDFHTVGLKSDGTVVGVGPASGDPNNKGQYAVDGWTDIVAISAGGRHTVGLKADGTVVATGDDEYGQCGVYGWTDIAAVAAGGGHTVGLKSDGTMIAVGDNKYGQCSVEGLRDILLPDRSNAKKH